MERIGCPLCKYFDDGNTCKAFPGRKGSFFENRIPEFFLSGERGHTEPIEGQQNDIVFERMSPEEEQQRVEDMINKTNLDAAQAQTLRSFMMNMYEKYRRLDEDMIDE
jgi:hypothetical protein